MDDTLLMNAGLSTSGVAILLVLYRLLKSVKGKKLVSSCCGRKMDVGFDVTDMTPQAPQLSIQNPMKATRSETHGLPITPKAMELPAMVQG